MIDWSLYPNFSEREFTCHCGCGRADMDPNFLAWLQGLRNAFKRPIVISSGFRCPDHNARVSKTGRDGPHTTGKAADIGVAGEPAFYLLSLAITRGAQGVGPKQHGPWDGRFIHIDMLADGDHPRPRLWTY